ncbi:ribbon-helix-helix protein, CopG family, partial [Escherichia coli]
MRFDGERVAALRAISRDDIGRPRMRTLVDIPEDDIRWLDRLAIETGKSRAALVRDAIASYRA